MDGYPRTHYVGNDQSQALRIGNGAEIDVNLAGSTIFGAVQSTSPTFSGLTGIAAGSSASEGNAWEELDIRQSSLDLGGLPGIGIVQTPGTSSTASTCVSGSKSATAPAVAPVPTPKNSASFGEGCSSNGRCGSRHPRIEDDNCPLPPPRPSESV